ncbi:MAG: undecaprenyl-diphosphate phosphatase [Balneolaceae bacterium]
MDLLQAFLLGLLQGITEFLPVSSSGHLALGRALLGTELAPGITFEIVVHFGSFCSIAVYYRKMIGEILSDLFRNLNLSAIQSGEFSKNKNVLLSGYILISMIPAGIVGFTLKEQIEEIFMNPLLVSVLLLVTGLLLFLTRFIKNLTQNNNVWKSLLIGFAQAFAILPGISRSGSTISTALFLKINRENAANFSFLMVLPVLAGAMLKEMLDLYEVGVITGALPLTVGFFTSFISGYLALTYLIILLKKDKFHVFAYYCWIVGISGIIYFM